jgi:CNT family concentrative nucleoside transporter
MIGSVSPSHQARHPLTAAIMTAPGTTAMAKLFEPETERPETYGNVKLDIPGPT